MALEDLNPAVRVEEILDGADIEPATRLEYFMKKAANEVPKPAGSSDAGKVVTVNEDGDGFELAEPASGGGIVDIAIGTRTAANGADNAIYVNGQELTTLEECATYLESVKDKVLRVYFPDYPEGVTSIHAVTGLTIYRAGNMAYGEFMQKLPQTGEINVQTFGYMPASD
jgi:hypothetical protein